MKAAPPGGGSRSGGGSLPSANRTLAERVGRIEWEHESINRRLNDGAKTFSEMHQSQRALQTEIAEMQKPKPMEWWKVAGFVLSLLALLGTMLWYAAKYPDRSEFNQDRQRNAERAKGFDRDLQLLKLEQVKIQSDVKTIKESQSRVERHFDEIKKDIKSMANTSSTRNRRR